MTPTAKYVRLINTKETQPALESLRKKAHGG